jgi:hypothetical protein
MTLNEADDALRKARDNAIVAHANELLRAGQNIDDPEFVAAIRKYARELEAWRISSIARINRIVAAASIIERGEGPLQ